MAFLLSMPNICMSFAVPPWLVAMDVLRLLVDVASSTVVTRTMIEQAGRRQYLRSD